jgi:ribosome-interacting GTPase 1
MASTNQSPFYKKAEEEFHRATTDEERIRCLGIMIKECPKHKSSENMLRNLKTRLKKLKSNLLKQKKSGKSSSHGIKKADMQCVLVGFTNSGKSTIFKTLTNLSPKISPYPFTTNEPQLGTFEFEDVQVQIIDAVSFPQHDKSLINSTDTLIFAIDDLSQIKQAEQELHQSRAKIIIIFNKEDLLLENEKRKIEATLKSKYKKYDYIFFSQTPTTIKINELMQKIFSTFPIIRIYTKEPKKLPSKTPMILKKDSTLKDAAEKILKGMSKKIKRAKIWGPSSKFGGQTIGLNHVLKDKDTIEFQTL